MSGNSIGKLFQVTTFGESHGVALGCIVDGVPPNIALTEADIQAEINRRKSGQSAYTSPRQEQDEIQILSGVFNGKTTGTSIGMLIKNQDQRSEDYNDIKDSFRPGHADYTYHKKYTNRDYRGGGRASARETVMRVAAGAIAKKYLREQYNIQITGFISQIGNIKINPAVCENLDVTQINSNPFFCPDLEAIPQFEQLLTKIKQEGNSIGAKITVVANNVPVGLGEPVFDRLDAELAHALMSINAVKGVEIGDGFAVVEQTGEQQRDLLTQQGFLTNHAGGILGGISTGQPIIAHVGFKPTSSIQIPGKTIDIDNNEIEIVTRGRHDPCVAIRAVPIVEAMTAIVLVDHLLRFKAQCL